MWFQAMTFKAWQNYTEHLKHKTKQFEELGQIFEESLTETDDQDFLDEHLKPISTDPNAKPSDAKAKGKERLKGSDGKTKQSS